MALEMLKSRHKDLLVLGRLAPAEVEADKAEHRSKGQVKWEEPPEARLTEKVLARTGFGDHDLYHIYSYLYSSIFIYSNIFTYSYIPIQTLFTYYPKLIPYFIIYLSPSLNIL